MDVAESLVSQFQRMVARDGGTLALLDVTDDVIRVGYQPGIDPDCADGACVLPERELEQLMCETLARRAPTRRVVVERIPPGTPHHPA